MWSAVWKNEKLKVFLWLLVASAGVITLWMAPDKTWAAAGAFGLALALGLLFLLQMRTSPAQEEDPELKELQESLEYYREMATALGQKVAEILGEPYLPPSEDWSDPKVFSDLARLLEQKKESGAFLIDEGLPDVKDVLSVNMVKMSLIKLFLLNTIEKTEEAANRLLEEFTGLIDLVSQTRKATEETLNAGGFMSLEDFQKLKNQSRDVVAAFENQSRVLQDFFKSMEGKFSRLDQAVVGIEGNLANMVEIAEQNNVIAINASIEASKLGAKGAGFKVLVTEILKSNEKTRDFISKISGLINQLREYNKEFTGLWTGEAKVLVENISGSRNFSSQVIDTLTDAFDGVNKVLERERGTSTQTADRLDRILSGMQFQDITRQQLENVIRHICGMEEGLGVLKSALRAAGWSLADDTPEIRLRVREEMMKIAKIHDERVILNALDTKH